MRVFDKSRGAGQVARSIPHGADADEHERPNRGQIDAGPASQPNSKLSTNRIDTPATPDGATGGETHYRVNIVSRGLRRQEPGGAPSPGLRPARRRIRRRPARARGVARARPARHEPDADRAGFGPYAFTLTPEEARIAAARAGLRRALEGRLTLSHFAPLAAFVLAMRSSPFSPDRARRPPPRRDRAAAGAARLS